MPAPSSTAPTTPTRRSGPTAEAPTACWRSSKRMPEMEQSKKMVNQESFIRHRITKAADQLKKLHKDNREKEITHLMYQCLTGKELQGQGVAELNDMGWLVDQNLKEIYKRIEGLKKAAGKGLGGGEAGYSGRTGRCRGRRCSSSGSRISGWGILIRVMISRGWGARLGMAAAVGMR
ncbi:UNVERIFIED_CONTAM: Agamous-like MADS-box protein [Sesamum calycinum]|uniref:Agamous-like MADS-box protein n=1 Tax=Sesamum calycinum TaxID=2727403 RepID=A0AAW2J5X0_9LAMI